jgi:pilus assembly protein Flp/PilA
MLAHNSKGQGMVEYAFILILVAFVIIVAISTLGGGVGNLYMSVVNQF